MVRFWPNKVSKVKLTPMQPATFFLSLYICNLWGGHWGLLLAWWLWVELWGSFCLPELRKSLQVLAPTRSHHLRNEKYGEWVCSSQSLSVWPCQLVAACRRGSLSWGCHGYLSVKPQLAQAPYQPFPSNLFPRSCQTYLKAISVRTHHSRLSYIQCQRYFLLPW